MQASKVWCKESTLLREYDFLEFSGKQTIGALAEHAATLAHNITVASESSWLVLFKKMQTYIFKENSPFGNVAIPAPQNRRAILFPEGRPVPSPISFGFHLRR